MKNVPAALERQVNSVLEYMRLREEAWELLAGALREGDPRKLRQAAERQQLAEAAGQRIGDGGK